MVSKMHDYLKHFSAHKRMDMGNDNTHRPDWPRVLRNNYNKNPYQILHYHKHALFILVWMSCPLDYAIYNVRTGWLLHSMAECGDFILHSTLSPYHRFVTGYLPVNVSLTVPCQSHMKNNYGHITVQVILAMGLLSFNGLKTDWLYKRSRS